MESIDKNWRWFSTLLIALAVALLLHADSVARYFAAPPGKVGVLISGPRSDVGDNYYYFTMLRHAPERLSPKAKNGDPDGGDHRNVNAVTNAYAAALYAGYGIFRLASAITPSSREALLLTSILFSALLAAAMMTFIDTLGWKERVSPACLGILASMALILVDAFGNSLYLGRFYWDNSLLTYYSNPTRLLNPTLFWAIGLLTAVFLVRHIRTRDPLDIAVAIALACLTGLFNLSMGGTLLLALALALAYETIVARVIDPRMTLVFLAAAAGLVWSYLQLRAYAMTPLGQDIRHGEYIGVAIRWQFLALLVMVPFVWRSLGRERVFVAALVASATIVGLLCESVNLGSRLWLRGAVIFAWAVAVFLVVRMVSSLAAVRLGVASSSVRWIRLGQFMAVPMLILLVFHLQRPDMAGWKGFVEADKWAMLHWADEHMRPGAIVASEDIEDSYLLTIYTKAKPLYAMYGLTNRTRDEELRRYFYTMRLFGKDRQALAYATSVDQADEIRYIRDVTGTIDHPDTGGKVDAIIFLELVLYFPYISDLSNCLADSGQHARLTDLLTSRAAEAAGLAYQFDFAIVDNRWPVPDAFHGWLPSYRNGRYSILQRPAGPVT